MNIEGRNVLRHVRTGDAASFGDVITRSVTEFAIPLAAAVAYYVGCELGFALRFPSRVRALMVTNSSSAAGLPLSVENLVMRARSIEITLTKGMDAMAEYAMAANPNLSERLALDPSARDEFYEEYRRLSPIGYANSLRALLAMDHITDQLPRLRMPVLLIGGDRDPSLAPMRVMHRKVRGSKLVVLSPASHFANRDQPEAWNRTVLEFLARCDRRTPRSPTLVDHGAHCGP